jgi:hypothetical protein
MILTSVRLQCKVLTYTSLSCVFSSCSSLQNLTDMSLTAGGLRQMGNGCTSPMQAPGNTGLAPAFWYDLNGRG